MESEVESNKTIRERKRASQRVSNDEKHGVEGVLCALASTIFSRWIFLSPVWNTNDRFPGERKFIVFSTERTKMKEEEAQSRIIEKENAMAVSSSSSS